MVRPSEPCDRPAEDVLLAGLRRLVARADRARLRPSRGPRAVAGIEAESRALLARAREAVAALAAHADLARDLHDALGHTLTVITLQAGAARRLWRSDPARARAALDTIAVVAREGLAELQFAVGPRSLGCPAKAASLGDLLAGARAAGLPLNASIDPVDAGLWVEKRAVAYRVVQEALTNVLKHAPGARTVLAVRLDEAAESVEIVVRNGAAARPGPDCSGAGRGLVGMRERVAACGGQVSWARLRHGGFEVRARLPIALVPA